MSSGRLGSVGSRNSKHIVMPPILIFCVVGQQEESKKHKMCYTHDNLLSGKGGHGAGPPDLSFDVII
jgi:hypothetical protein